MAVVEPEIDSPAGSNFDDPPRSEDGRDLYFPVRGAFFRLFPTSLLLKSIKVETPELEVEHPGHGIEGNAICLPIVANLCLFKIDADFGLQRYEGGIVATLVRDLHLFLGDTLFKALRNQRGVVKADRRSPTPNEAMTWVDFGLNGWWSKDPRSASSTSALLRKSIRQDADQHIQWLAQVAHADLVLKAVKIDAWGDSQAREKLSELQGMSEQLSRVNGHLERSLFTQKLYEVCCESALMVPLDVDENEPHGYYTLSQPAAVRVLLRDQNGAKFEFQDVGSGISYVLPVLLSCTSNGLSMIQQPELHLHPALQSSVADVFIEEMNDRDDVQFLIETHSEHLLEAPRVL